MKKQKMNEGTCHLFSFHLLTFPVINPTFITTKERKMIEGIKRKENEEEGTLGQDHIGCHPSIIDQKMERKKNRKNNIREKSTATGRYANPSDVVADYIFFSPHFIFIYLQGDSLEERGGRNRQRQT